MSKEKNFEDGVWRTVGGRRIFIRNGQGLADAMRESRKFPSNKYIAVNIEIDKLTDCLEDKHTGEEVETEYGSIKINSIDQRKLKKEGWKFNWSKTPGEVYALRVKGSRDIQGLISFRHEMGYTEVHLVESNPHNIGRNGRYTGVGGHLFAIACYKSRLNGNGGFVTFVAKSNLIEHYRSKIGATQIGNSNKMYISEKTAASLIDKYLKK